MDLKLVITIVAWAAIANGIPVPPSDPKYVPVFISSDALKQLNEKDGQTGNKAQANIEYKPEPISRQGSNSDYDIKKDVHNILNGSPPPVYEHQLEQHEPSYSPPQYNQPQAYQSQQPGQVQQYLNNQQPASQTYQLNQPTPMQPSYQINQQPSQIQQYQNIQPAQPQQLYQINQQPGQLQQIVTQPALQQQPVYGNQHQILSGQQPMLFNQQLMAQPIQTYQQPNQLLISSQPTGTQQTILTQPAQPILLNQQAPIPNQQPMLLQQPQNGQALFTSNISPINLGQPNNQINPGYIQNQNQNVYAVVPVNQNVAPNQNVGSSTYLVPVQQVPNQVFAVNSG